MVWASPGRGLLGPRDRGPLDRGQRRLLCGDGAPELRAHGGQPAFGLPGAGGAHPRDLHAPSHLERRRPAPGPPSWRVSSRALDRPAPGARRSGQPDADGHLRGEGPRDEDGVSAAPAPRVTVVFLLYNAARTTPALVAALAGQRRPGEDDQAHWLEALF